MTPEELQKLLNDLASADGGQTSSMHGQMSALTAGLNGLAQAASGLAGQGMVPNAGGALIPPSALGVALPSDLTNFVNGLVKSGKYVNAEEVVRDALRRMQCDPCFKAPEHSGLKQMQENAKSMAGSNIKASDTSLVSGSLAGLWDDIKSTSGDLPPGAEGVIGLRRLIGLVGRDLDANRARPETTLDLSHGVGSERGYMFLRAPVVDASSVQGWTLATLESTERGVRSRDQLEAVSEELSARLDELGEMLMLRLQMKMDRKAKITQTLSNVLKKITQAQDEIARNMK